MKSRLEIEQQLHLRENAIHNVGKTGYPHLDKSHLQFYSENHIIIDELPETSMYAALYSSIAKNGTDAIAIEYFGRKITYGEFLSRINEYADTFQNLGIKKGEVVSIAAPNLPEIFYAIYALNKIGAVANLIDPRNNLDRIKQFINQADSTRLIMIDLVYPKIEKIIKETKLEAVYTVSAADSLPLGLNYIQRAKTVVENHRKGLANCPKNETYVPLTQIVSEYKKRSGINYTSLPDEFYSGEKRKDEVAIIVNTSGTTGTPKGVMLTNENLNAVAYDYLYSGMEYKIGDGFLGIMPNFLAYGIGVGTHMTFILGLKNIIIPALKSEEFGKLIRKHKPAHFAGVPTHYQYLMDDPKMEGVDLSFIKTPAAGGMAFDPELKRKTNEFLASHNCQSRIKVGYGCSENTGMASSQFHIGESTPENDLQTVGIPAFYTTFRVVSPETGEDLKYNQDGEILLSGKGVMAGYVDNPEETNKVIEVIDGERHLHTGDIGHVDENGCIYVVDRIKRIIIRPDGHNVFPSYIEKVVTKHPFVKACTCVGVKDVTHVNGQAPVAFIVIEEGHEAEVEQIISELETMSLNELPERDIALDYVVIESMPMTPAGKVDYLALETMHEYNPLTRNRKR